MPESPATLTGQPSLSPGAVNLILFSRADCAFCRIVREHYLLPLAAKRPPRLFLADIDIESRAMMTGWQRQRLTQAAFAASHGARLSPTVIFVDSQGRELAEPIVGLSNDFFGAYLDAAIAKALAAPI